jgi:hypothetical protein
MSTFSGLWTQITGRIAASPRQRPSTVRIPADHVDPGKPTQAGHEPSDRAFRSDEDYFQVRVNEMFLHAARKWFSAIDPVVFVVSEYIYDKGEEPFPFMIGPAMIEKNGQKAAKGMVLTDTRVAGLHPFRGGRLSLSVVLSQVTVNNHARQLLKVMESVSGALDFATVVMPYVKVANVLVEGFESLMGLGGTVPLVGMRTEFDPDSDIEFTPGYFTLIDKPDVAPETLWVREGRLYVGATEDKVERYEAADFVLYSVVRDPDNERADLRLLPFYPQWEMVKKEATVPKPENWKNAKVLMANLYQLLMLSPDLTTTQAQSLADAYADTMKKLYDRAVDLATRGSEATSDAELDRVRDKALAILNL